MSCVEETNAPIMNMHSVSGRKWAAGMNVATMIKHSASSSCDVIVHLRLKAGDKVQLVGFGTFEVKALAERTGRNPKTGEAMTIAASKKPAFAAGKALKDAVN